MTLRISPSELADYGPLFDNAKRLRALVAELQTLTLAIVEAEADASGHPWPRATRRTRSV